MMQRFKAVEAASVDGHWQVASKYELLPEHDASTVSAAERGVVLRERELAELMKRS